MGFGRFDQFFRFLRADPFNLGELLGRAWQTSATVKIAGRDSTAGPFFLPPRDLVHRVHPPGGDLIQSAGRRRSALAFAADIDLPSVSLAASRTFCPRRPMARESWSSSTMTSMDLVSWLMMTLEISAGARALQTKLGRILAPGDDVDLLPPELLNHRLDP